MFPFSSDTKGINEGAGRPISVFNVSIFDLILCR